jgi:hypothetical protein
LLDRLPWALGIAGINWIYLLALFSRQLKVREIGSTRHSGAEARQETGFDLLVGLQRKNELELDCARGDALVVV